ncbi:MAG: ABC-ATPase domain-containing protein [Acetatifactor sp.]|nr:ABC-ATPase domain-containing protein [Acetatifactor sp.]
MKTAEELRQLLDRIDHRGYPAYKDTKGRYDFGRYILNIEHVQGDPFASPSKVSLCVEGRKAGFLREYYEQKHRRISLQDYLLRRFAVQTGKFSFQAKGSGKSGLLGVSRPGQEILERSACHIDEKNGDVLIRMEIGFPANGRTVNAGELKKILFEFLPQCVEKTLFAKAYRPEALLENAYLADDRLFIRQEMGRLGLVVFIADGSVLPRESGVSDKPLKGAVPFTSPDSLAVTLELPHKGSIRGMGLKRGITMIAGGGYHGKSTLLKAIERGVYDHIAGDGREFVMTDGSAMKIRAEDGRSVRGVDISLFIRELPNGKDTKEFHTEDASGSTSQAANVIEALEAGSQVLLIDEDTSATNFMVRDELMQQVVHPDKEPIIPFLYRVRELYEHCGISTVLVAGSSGTYFHKADCILQMDNYRALNITEKAKQAALAYPLLADAERDFIEPVYERRLRGEQSFWTDERLKIKSLGMEGILLHKESVDLRYVEQLVDEEQIHALCGLLKQSGRKLLDGKRSLKEVVDFLWEQLMQNGVEAAAEGNFPPGNLAMPRKQEIFACLNRCRRLHT